MTNIKLISELRNYTEVLNEVTEDSPVYLTRNGKGEFAILALKDYDKLKATIKLLSELNEGEQSGIDEDWIPANEVKDILSR